MTYHREHSLELRKKPMIVTSIVNNVLALESVILSLVMTNINVSGVDQYNSK